MTLLDHAKYKESRSSFTAMNARIIIPKEMPAKNFLLDFGDYGHPQRLSIFWSAKSLHCLRHLVLYSIYFCKSLPVYFDVNSSTEEVPVDMQMVSFFVNNLITSRRFLEML